MRKSSASPRSAPRCTTTIASKALESDHLTPNDLEVEGRAVGAAHEPIAHLAPDRAIHATGVRSVVEVHPPDAKPVIRPEIASVSAEPEIRPGPLLEQDHPSPLHALPDRLRRVIHRITVAV